MLGMVALFGFYGGVWFLYPAGMGLGGGDCTGAGVSMVSDMGTSFLVCNMRAEAWFVALDQNSVKWHTKKRWNDSENGSSSDAARAVAE